MRLARRVPLLLLCASLSMGCPGGAPETAPPGNSDAILRGLGAALGWLEAHPPDRRREELAYRCLDAWSWYVFATWHPDPRVRSQAGDGVDRRLRAIEPPREWGVVSLSYWATVLQLRKNRGVEPGITAAWRKEFDLDTVLEGGSPTTTFYILQLLEHVGLPTDPDVSSTWIATASRADSGAR